MGADAIELAPAPRTRSDSLARRASFTAVASALDYVAKMVVTLVVTPILVHGLGRSLYGVWFNLDRLTNYMTATDGRHSDALRLIVAKDSATADGAQQRRHVGSALAVFILFLPVVAVVGAGVTLLAPIITKVGPELRGTVRLACALLIAGYVVASLGSIPESVLRGMNLGYRRMGLQTGLNIIGGVLIVGAVTGGFGLIGLGLAQVILAAITGLVFLVLAKRYVAWFGTARPERADVRGMLDVSVWLGLGDLISKLLLSSDSLVLGWVVSPVAVTTYTLTSYAAKTGIGILTFTLAAAMPGLGGVIGRGQMPRAAALRREILDGTWVFAVAAGATILAWNRAFIALWTGAVNYAGPVADLLIVLLAAQTAFIRADAYIIDAALRPRARVIASAAAAGASLGLSLIGCRLWGIPGLCLGLLAGRGIQSVAFPIFARRSLAAHGERVASDGPGTHARRLVTMVAIFAVAAALSPRVVVHQWVVWGLGAGLSAIVAFTVAFYGGLDAERRARVVMRLRALKSGRRTLP